MPRELTSGQSANVLGTATKPVYLVDWEHSGVQELIACTAGDVVYNGMTYNAGDVSVLSIQNGRSARLSVPASAARVTQTQNGSWRGGRCKIYMIPALPSDELTFLEAEAFLVLDGEIRTSGFSGGRVNIMCENVRAGSRMAPIHTFNAICNHLPAAGTVITWEGDTIVLESPR